MLQKAYDRMEQEEIENILATRTKDDKTISHSKTLDIDT